MMVRKTKTICLISRHVCQNLSFICRKRRWIIKNSILCTFIHGLWLKKEKNASYSYDYHFRRCYDLCNPLEFLIGNKNRSLGCFIISFMKRVLWCAPTFFVDYFAPTFCDCFFYENFVYRSFSLHFYFHVFW